MKCIAYYKSLFLKLNVNKKGSKIAPHKAILLVSIIEMIESGIITTPFIELSPSLESHFNSNWRKYVRENQYYNCKLCYPFFHLASSGFWELIKTESHEEKREYSSMTSLKRNFRGALLDKELFQIIQSSQHREELLNILLTSYLL